MVENMPSSGDYMSGGGCDVPNDGVHIDAEWVEPECLDFNGHCVGCGKGGWFGTDDVEQQHLKMVDRLFIINGQRGVYCNGCI